VGRMRGDARVAGAENGVHARPAADRRAAAAGLALVAGGGEVPVVGAARSLQEVPSHGRDVAQLRRGACEDRLCEHRQALLDPGMLGDPVFVAIASMRTPFCWTSILRKSSLLTSTTWSGFSTSIFIRSTSEVPPARNAASGRAPPFIADSTLSARW